MPEKLFTIIITIFGTTVFLIIIIIVLFVKHFEKIEYIISKICKLFRWCSNGLRKSGISLEIQSKVLKASKEIAEESCNILPYNLKIKWVKETDVETLLENNQIIVRMSDKYNKTHNMIYAINEYIAKGLIPKARKYIDKSVMKATDLIVTRKIIHKCWDEGLEHFDTQYLDKIREDNDDINDMITKIKELDDTNLLYSVLLREFQKAGMKVYPAIEDECLKDESREFIGFLYNIATKEPGVNVNLNINRVYFKVHILIVGIKDTMRYQGIAPYCKTALNSLGRGTETVYILSDSTIKKEFTESIIKNITSRNINIKNINRFRYGRKIKPGYLRRGECIAVETCSYEEDLVV
ncbi:MAG: hypothetical protein PHO15_05440 [Eubacteriales bacterium]|nr:hypothetical protein [Eubacteriales bacterium]